MTTTEPQWKVGDEVIVTGRYASRGRKKILKVGRKYFYVEGNDCAFELANGRQKHDGYGNYMARAWTPEDYEADQVRSEVLKQLGDLGVRWSDSFSKDMVWRSGNLTTARLYELLHFVNQIAEELPHHDLDRI